MEQELSGRNALDAAAGPGRLAERLAFGPSIDRPAGFYSGVTSGITGNTLRYFTPDPLPELLARAISSPKPRHDRDRYAPLLLLRAASTRPADSGPNLAQAQRLVSALFEGRRYDSMDALLQLGRSISPKAAKIREEIIFVGGVNSSAARHIYAPHGAIPDLVQSLIVGLSGKNTTACDPVVATATTAAFCSFLHPFNDGNGRWSRVVALSMMATANHGWPSMSVLVFLNAHRILLTNDMFPFMASNGMRSYLEACLLFEDELTSKLEANDAFLAATVLCEMLHELPAKWRSLATEIFVTGRVRGETLRKECGVSQRVANGFIDRTSTALPDAVNRIEDGIEIEQLLAKVDEAICSASRSNQ